MDDASELRQEAGRTQVSGVWARGGPVFSHLTAATVQSLEGRTIASFGDAASFGFWSVGSGLLATGLLQTGAFSAVDPRWLFPTLLVYSGIMPLIAGLFLYRRNNAVLASAFCSFGALNLTRGLFYLAQSSDLMPEMHGIDLMQATMMESFAYVSLSLFVAALRINVVASFMTATAALGYALSGLPALAGWSQGGPIGGCCLVASGVAAFYGGSALTVNTAWQRVVLPIGGKA